MGCPRDAGAVRAWLGRLGSVRCSRCFCLRLASREPRNRPSSVGRRCSRGSRPSTSPPARTTAPRAAPAASTRSSARCSAASIRSRERVTTTPSSRSPICARPRSTAHHRGSDVLRRHPLRQSRGCRLRPLLLPRLRRLARRAAPAVPRAWAIAFGAADERAMSAAGNLALGINAHVQRDLPFVLAAIGLVKPDGSSRKPRSRSRQRVPQPRHRRPLSGDRAPLRPDASTTPTCPGPPTTSPCSRSFRPGVRSRGATPNDSSPRRPPRRALRSRQTSRPTPPPRRTRSARLPVRPAAQQRRARRLLRVTPRLTLTPSSRPSHETALRRGFVVSWDDRGHVRDQHRPAALQRHRP